MANAQMVTLAQNHPAAGASLTGRAAADQTLNLTVALTLRDQAKLDKLLANQQDPKSAQFHQWLTPAQFSQRFGRTQQEVNAISNWLTANGFHVTAASGRQITAVGNAAIAEAAFHTTIATSPDGSVFANLSDPEIPTNLNGLIGSIDGLDNTRHAVPLAHQVSAAPALASALALDGTTGNGVEPDYTGNLGTAFGPGDFYTFYDESPLLNTSINGGGNDCVAFIEDSDFLASAVTLFDTTFSLSTASVTKIFPDTSNPGTNGDEIEVLLDIEWGHAVAPGAAIRVYEASSLSDAINGAVQDNVCGVISISYAYCGSSVAFFSGTLDPMFSQAASQGQSVFISAGDEGSAGLSASCGVGTTQNVNEMSADTHVTAVGGTQFVPAYSSGKDSGSVTESVWNDPAGATGGGKSAVFAKPSFQTASTPADGKRDVPDVAYGSSPYYPGYYWATDSSGTAAMDCCIGGTSIAAPMWAGIAKLLNQENGRVGNIDTRVYQMGPSGSSAGFRDITLANDSANHSVGSNTYNSVAGFSAGAGYGQSTGWGSADATNFVNAFPSSAAPPTPTSTATPTPTATPSTTPSPSPTPSPTRSPSPTATPTPARPSAPTISPTSVTFGSVKARNTSAAHGITITNPRNSPAHLVLSGFTVSSQFSINSPTTTCTNSSSLAAGSSCTIGVRFAPTSTGRKTGSLSISDNASNSPQSVSLSGTGS